MKKPFSRSIGILSLLIALVSFYSCSQNDAYEISDEGLKYKFFEQTKEGDFPQIGDLVKLQMYYQINDSIIYDTRNNEEPVRFQITESQYEGDIYSALRMMRPGDSASFILSADSFFITSAGMKELPPFAKAGQELTFFIKMHEMQTKAAFEEEQKQQQMQNQAREMEMLKQYVEQNNITTEPKLSGLYYIVLEEGNGEPPVEGQAVTVHYTGTFLDGTVFDSSKEADKPFTFKYKVDPVIPGWVEALGYMNPGTKVKLIIPSQIAYGPQGYPGRIPPFTTLVFEVELLSVE